MGRCRDHVPGDEEEQVDTEEPVLRERCYLWKVSERGASRGARIPEVEQHDGKGSQEPQYVQAGQPVAVRASG